MDHYTYEEYDWIFKIVLVGDTGVGKSNLLTRFVRNEFNIETKSTLGVEFSSKTLEVNEEGIKVQFWDTAGQERFKSIAISHYRGALGALLVYDITRRETFESCAEWLKEIRGNAHEDVVVTLVGNKTDLNHLRQVSKDEGLELSKKHSLAFIGKDVQRI
mmetsp:Transcript_31657/g.35980  ORF Transcript_31657/g.35980 Transcript_31657/m.35980 type:complete len:160 (-) Transcript_31657:89-568(-)